ncbi:hypothetical protein C8R46DRAFT_1215192 [Mycena filopes]|nr:hypothetical protein C8R46DRAFT_1215192 [Mycena filopes]
MPSTTVASVARAANRENEINFWRVALKFAFCLALVMPLDPSWPMLPSPTRQLTHISSTRAIFRGVHPKSIFWLCLCIPRCFLIPSIAAANAALAPDVENEVRRLTQTSRVLTPSLHLASYHNPLLRPPRNPPPPRGTTRTHKPQASLGQCALPLHALVTRAPSNHTAFPTPRSLRACASAADRDVPPVSVPRQTTSRSVRSGASLVHLPPVSGAAQPPARLVSPSLAVRSAFDVLTSRPARLVLRLDVLNTTPPPMFVSDGEGTRFVESLRDTNWRRTRRVVSTSVTSTTRTTVSVLEIEPDWEAAAGVPGVAIRTVVANAAEVVGRLCIAPAPRHPHTVSPTPHWAFDSAGVVVGVGRALRADVSVVKSDDVDAFLSTDAGVTWSRLSTGAALHEFADAGNILVMLYVGVDAEHHPTYDLGELIVPLELIPVPITPGSDAGAWKFILLPERSPSTSTERYVLIYLDFSGACKNKCSAGDFEMCCWKSRTGPYALSSSSRSPSHVLRVFVMQQQQYCFSCNEHSPCASTSRIHLALRTRLLVPHHIAYAHGHPHPDRMQLVTSSLASDVQRSQPDPAQDLTNHATLVFRAANASGVVEALPTQSLQRSSSL